MSRTHRLKYEVIHKVRDSNGYIPTYFRSSPFNDARRRAAEEEHDGYRPRRRHTCMKWPHYLSIYEDICPSIGLWVFPEKPIFRRKPKHTNKKNPRRG